MWVGLGLDPGSQCQRALPVLRPRPEAGSLLAGLRIERKKLLCRAGVPWAAPLLLLVPFSSEICGPQMVELSQTPGQLRP